MTTVMIGIRIFIRGIMRKTGKDYLIFDPEDIQEKLGLEHVPEDAYGRMDIFRLNVEVAERVTMNYFIDSKDVENH